MILIKSIGLVLVCVGALLPPGPAHGQQQVAVNRLLDGPSRLRVKDVSLGHALDELTRTAGISLAYSPSLLQLDKKVSCFFFATTGEVAPPPTPLRRTPPLHA